jgi:hypothetical protein
MGTADTVTLIRREVKLPAADAKLPQFPADIPGINPLVYQSAQGHIAGNSGKRFKVQGLQGKTPELFLMNLGQLPQKLKFWEKLLIKGIAEEAAKTPPPYSLFKTS